jgi:hypothetical protein
MALCRSSQRASQASTRDRFALGRDQRIFRRKPACRVEAQDIGDMSPVRDVSVCVGAGFGPRLNRIGRLGSGSLGARSLGSSGLGRVSAAHVAPWIDRLDVGFWYFLRRLRFLGEFFP